jgi:hypothetical protein
MGSQMETNRMDHDRLPRICGTPPRIYSIMVSGSAGEKMDIVRVPYRIMVDANAWSELHAGCWLFPQGTRPPVTQAVQLAMMFHRRIKKDIVEEYRVVTTVSQDSDYPGMGVMDYNLYYKFKTISK